MKKLLFVVMLFVFSNALDVQAETLTAEQAAIKNLLKKMYEIDPDTFEFAMFDAKYKNGKMVVKAKHDPDRQCRLLAKFLVKEAIIREKGVNQGCMTGVNGYFRYPLFDSMDLGSDTRTSRPQPPHVNTPAVNGDKAKVQVIFTNGTNVIYYLRKPPEGWRIYRVESSHTSATIDTMNQGEYEGDIVDIFPPEVPND